MTLAYLIPFWLVLAKIQCTVHFAFCFAQMTHQPVEITSAKQTGASKVENILKGSLDLILSPLPSVKIQIMAESLLEV